MRKKYRLGLEGLWTWCRVDQSVITTATLLTNQHGENRRKRGNLPSCEPSTCRGTSRAEERRVTADKTKGMLKGGKTQESPLTNTRRHYQQQSKYFQAPEEEGSENDVSFIGQNLVMFAYLD